MKYPAIIENGGIDYGIVFPDLPGIVAMGPTFQQAKANAEEALREYALESERDGLPLTPPSAPEHLRVSPGSALTHIQLVRSSTPA